MKKLLLLAVLSFSVLALVACNSEASKLPEGAAESSKIKIGFSQATMNHPFRIAMVEEFKKYLEENHPEIEFLLTDGKDNASTQVSDVETLVSQGINLLVISPHSSDALTPAVEEVMKSGIPVITVDRTVNTPVTVHVGADNTEIGELFGKYIIEQVDGEGKVIELQGTAGSSATIERHEGFQKAIEGTSVEVVADQHADYLREPAMAIMEDMLQRFSKPNSIQAVYAHNDEMGLGALNAIEAAGREGEIKVFSIDGQENAFEAVSEGRLAASAIYPHGGREAAETAVKVLNDEKLDELLKLQFDIVDESNSDNFLGTGI